MIIINVGLTAHRVAKIITAFKKYGFEGEIVHDGGDKIPEKTISFLDDMASEGFVKCAVSDWGYQEVSYSLTEIGKQITRTT